MGITYCASIPSSTSYPILRINNSHHRRNLESGVLPFPSSLSDSALNLNPLIVTPNEQHLLFSSSRSLSACSQTLLRQLDVRVRESSLTEFAGKRPKSGSVVQTLELGLMIGLWYLFNIYFNIYNKQLLKVFPYPMTITSFHFFLGSIIILLLWGSNIYKKPTYTTTQLLLIVPLALTHTFGNLFTNMSIGKVAVSFTHTIKAMEPFFSVLLSALFLGEMPSVWVLSSLVPVVGGVVLASLTEASFNWAGFLSAMASNVTNQSRNVFSKKLMVKEKKQDAMADINLFSVLTIMSFFTVTATALLVEGVKFTPAYLQSTGMNVNELYPKALIAGIIYDIEEGISCDTFSGQLCEACYSDWHLSHLLPYTSFPNKCSWNWGCTSRSLPLLESKAHERKDPLAIFIIVTHHWDSLV